MFKTRTLATAAWHSICLRGKRLSLAKRRIVSIARDAGSIEPPLAHTCRDGGAQATRGIGCAASNASASYLFARRAAQRAVARASAFSRAARGKNHNNAAARARIMARV